MAHVRSFVGTRNCATCGNQFRLRADAAKAGRGLYCSIKCSNEGRLGRIEREVLAFLEDEGITTAEDVANAIYDGRITRSQIVAILRAMHSLVRKYPDRYVMAGGKGREPLWIGTPSKVKSVLD